MSTIQEIQGSRRHIFGSDPLIGHLEHLEYHHGSLKHSSAYDHRKELAFQLAEKAHGFFMQVNRSGTRYAELTHSLEQAKAPVQALTSAIYSSNPEHIKHSFHQLPQDFRNWICWSIWMRASLGNYANGDLLYGEHQIEQNPLILKEISDKFIHLKGYNLADQLLSYVDEQISKEHLQTTVRILEDLERLVWDHSPNRSLITSIFQTLPFSTQNRLCYDVYAAAQWRREDFEWGRNELVNSPHLLRELNHPGSHEKIISFHLREAREQLGRLNTLSDLMEVERMSLLYPYAPSNLQQELKKWLEPSVKRWISELERENGIDSHQKLYESRGAHYSNGWTAFEVYAPHARNIALILTSHGAHEHRLDMQKNHEGVWKIRTYLAAPGRTYLYLVTDCHGKETLRVDPFSFSISYIAEAGQLQSVVVDPASYRWSDQRWMERRSRTNALQQPLSIYEVQLKSWKSGYHQPLSLDQITPELIHHCKKMNFTHVELYGILEHFNRDEKGYQIASFFAPYRDHGSINDVKHLINELHRNGLGVIIDLPLAHFHHFQPAHNYAFSLNDFDGTNLFGAEFSHWGTRYFDYGKQEPQRLMEASTMYWIEQMHVDGFRFDAVSPIIQRDYRNEAGISFLKDLNQAIHYHGPGVLTIAEETEGFPNVTKPIDQGGLGFDLKWGTWWNSQTRDYFSTPPLYRQNKHGNIRSFLKETQEGHYQWGDRLILSHSHDDSDHGTLLQRVYHHHYHWYDKLSELRNFRAFQTLSPSRGNLLHMGDEIAQIEPWSQRFQRGESSMDWGVLNEDLHRKFQTCVGDLNALYKNCAHFWKEGERDFQMISDNASTSVFAYHRGTVHKTRIAVIHNFENREFPLYDVPLPSDDYQVKKLRAVREIFNTNADRYGGSNACLNHHVEILRSPYGEPTHFRLALPPMSTVVLWEELDD